MDNNSTETYRLWLEEIVNDYAKLCSDYVQGAGESPPAKLTEPYNVYQAAWDSFCILVENDRRYKKSRSLDSFITDYADLDYTGTELYVLYVQNIMPTEYAYADHSIEAMNKVLQAADEIE